MKKRYPLNEMVGFFDYLRNVTHQLAYTRRFGSVESEKVDRTGGHTSDVVFLSWAFSQALNDAGITSLDQRKVDRIAHHHDDGEHKLKNDVEYSPLPLFPALDKVEQERLAMLEAVKHLHYKYRQTVLSFWEEYEEQKTEEAKFVKVVDKLAAAPTALEILEDKNTLLAHDWVDSIPKHYGEFYGYFPALDPFIEWLHNEFIQANFNKIRLEWKAGYELGRLAKFRGA